MTQTIADWLETLQLGQYAERFVENGIDLNVLPELTDQFWKSSVSWSDTAANCCVISPIARLSRTVRLWPPPRLSRLDRTRLSAAGSR
jgi:hypothetical protein